MKIYAILNDDYGAYTIKKLFISESKQLEEFDRLISLEKIEYENKYKQPYEKRGYNNISLETFETED